MCKKRVSQLIFIHILLKFSQMLIFGLYPDNTFYKAQVYIN